MVRLHIDHHIGARTCHDTLLKVGGLHVNDTAVRVSQVIHQSRIRLTGGDRQYLTLRLDFFDLSIFGSTVMVCAQMLQAFFDRLAVHQTSAGEIHIVLQSDGPGQITVIFP